MPQGVETVRLEISVSILTRLLSAGHLKAADLRCLDCASMNCLRRSCLKSCVWRDFGASCGVCGPGPCCPEKEDGGGSS